jgi:FKBP-type peptidyl-prolyl cis-trans isomerase
MQILVTTEEWKLPNDSATVTLRYVARLPDGTVFDERGEGNELQFKMNEGARHAMSCGCCAPAQPCAAPHAP